MGILAPEFWITVDQMRDEGLPETFDYFRFQKGAANFPFICIHPDPCFLNMITLDEMEWPNDLEFTSTKTETETKMPGIYKMFKSKAAPQRLLDEHGKVINPSNKESFLYHLKMMKEQNLDMDMDEKCFRDLLSREHLENESSFVYNENLAFSVLNKAASSKPDFPQKWNFNNIPGPLKSFCSGNDGLNEIIGVSSSMIFAGKRGTFSSWHVEDADCPSCNLLLPFSAGKAWIGILPDDEWILDEYIRKTYRKNCITPTLHKDLLLDLDLLDELGIPWYYFIQRAGDIIITNPAVRFMIFC
uniref:JmjC domain-containing protein n=1 Tax=Panagrolaimus superbus TaxID=310955 RepID=A0A914YMF3_9BILA